MSTYTKEQVLAMTKEQFLALTPEEKKQIKTLMLGLDQQ